MAAALVALLLWIALRDVASVELYKCESFLPNRRSSPLPHVMPITEPISAASIMHLQSIFIDHRDLFYYTEKMPRFRLRAVNFTTGNVSTIHTGIDPLQGPATLWVDSTGQLFVVDEYRGQVIQVPSQQSSATVIAGSEPIHQSDGRKGYQSPAKNAWLHNIRGICGDTAGNIFVVDSRTVRMIDNQRQSVTLVAGDLRYAAEPLDASPSISDIPAVNMTMFGPTACAVDSMGNVYFSETASPRIRKINRLTARAELVAGTGGMGFDGDHGPATAANLGLPTAMWIDSSAYLYVATLYGQHLSIGATPTALRRIELFGDRRIITLAGYGYNSSQLITHITIGGERPFFQSVSSITGDRQGSVYLATLQGVVVCRNATLPTQSPTPLPTLSPTTSPHGSLRGPLITLSPTPVPTHLPLRSVDRSNAYAALAFGHSPDVLPVFRDGDPMDRVRTSSLSACFVDLSGDVYYAERQNVKKVIRASNTVVSVSRPVLMHAVSALWMDTIGNLYIADQKVGVIWKTQVKDANSTLTVYAGKLPPKQTGFPTPAAPTSPLDPHGIGDHGPATLASLYEPHGLCGDTMGRLYIVDSNHHRIRAVALPTAAVSSSVEAVITTIAGNSMRGFSGDGGPATLASLSFPYACAVDARSGVVYVADKHNARIRQLVPSPLSILLSPPSQPFDSSSHNPAAVGILSWTIDTFLGTGDTFESHMNMQSGKESAIGRPMALWIDPWGHLFVVTIFAMTMVQRWPLPPSASNPAPFEEKEVEIISPFKDMVRLLKYNVHTSTLEIVAGGGKKIVSRSHSSQAHPAWDISIHSGWGLCGDTSGALYLPFEHGSQLVVKIFDGRGQSPDSLGAGLQHWPSASPSPQVESSTPSRAPIGRLRGVALPPWPSPQPPSSSLSLDRTFQDQSNTKSPLPSSYLHSAPPLVSGNLSTSSVTLPTQSFRQSRPSGPAGEAALALRTRGEGGLEKTSSTSLPVPPPLYSPLRSVSHAIGDTLADTATVPHTSMEAGIGKGFHGSWTAWLVAAGLFGGVLIWILWKKRSERTYSADNDFESKDN